MMVLEVLLGEVRGDELQRSVPQELNPLVVEPYGPVSECPGQEPAVCTLNASQLLKLDHLLEIFSKVLQCLTTVFYMTCLVTTFFFCPRSKGWVTTSRRGRASPQRFFSTPGCIEASLSSGGGLLTCLGLTLPSIVMASKAQFGSTTQTR